VAEQTNGGLVYVASGWPVADFERVKHDIDANLKANVERCAPDLADRMRDARREAPYRGTADMRFFFRKPFGPGWALVGDAGYLRDAVTGQGITDAFRDADLLADAIDAALGGIHPLEVAPALYERCRNEAVMPMYEFTYDLARLVPPTEQQQALFGALRDNQAQIERFLGTIAGTVAIPEFFGEANVQHVMAEALPRVA
jgi:flavin-dependent dehydrogenase